MWSRFGPLLLQGHYLLTFGSSNLFGIHFLSRGEAVTSEAAKDAASAKTLRWDAQTVGASRCIERLSPEIGEVGWT